MAKSLDRAVIVAPMHHTTKKTMSYYTAYVARYDKMTSFEKEHHEEAIGLAALREGEQVLEVACGTGKATVPLARLVGSTGRVDALDVTEAMVEATRQKLQACGLSERVTLQVGDARQLPYPEHTFDALYNSYMFDLLPVDQFVPILAEFQRVLKPGGRLILLNMSKNRPEKTWFETLYATGWVGACRPVLLKTYVQQAGFEDVQRLYRKSYVHHLLLPFGAEMITAHTHV